MVFPVIYKSKGSNGTGSDTQVSFQPLVRCKSEFALAESFFKVMNIKQSEMFKNYKVMSVPFMIAEKDVLDRKSVV